MIFEWRDLASAAAVLTVVGGLIFTFARVRLRDDFARTGDVKGLSDRVGLVEARIATMPNHSDIHSLTSRLALVEQQVGVVGAEVRGVADGIRRVEHMTDMLVKHHMGRADT